jgi:hypothetical protein
VGLEAGTGYELKLTLSDPDGGGAVQVLGARTRGEPVDGGSTRGLARRYRTRRRGFDLALEAATDGTSGRLAADDAGALANMRATLPWLDELEPTPGARPTEGGATDEEPAVARERAALYRRFGRAVSSLRLDGETLDRLTVLGRLATEDDPDRRRALFAALAPVWRVVDGDGADDSPYRRLLRASAARWATHGSPIEANATALGLPAGSLEATLHEVLAAWRSMLGQGRIEPWDYWFVTGAAARRLDELVPADRLQSLNDRYLADLGADPRKIGISYDIRPRNGRPPVPVAFTLGMGAWAADQPASGPWTPRPPWVFATYAVGSLGNMLELLHESGHALHMAAVRTRPAFLDFPEASAAYLEGTADLLGWDVDEPAWQRHWLGAAAEPREALLSRYGAVMLDVCWALFEIELHRHPRRRPNDVWTEVTADGLGVEPHPDWSWWAIRGQLIDGPGYLANYALSAIMAAAVRARIAEVRGPWWTGDPGWYRFVADALFVPGSSRPPAALLESFLGRPLSGEPLLADLRRAG